MNNEMFTGGVYPDEIFSTGDCETVTPTESGRVNRPAAPFPRSGESRRCAEPAPRQQENPEISSGVSGQDPRDVTVAALVVSKYS